MCCRVNLYTVFFCFVVHRTKSQTATDTPPPLGQWLLHKPLAGGPGSGCFTGAGRYGSYGERLCLWAELVMGPALTAFARIHFGPVLLSALTQRNALS